MKKITNVLLLTLIFTSSMFGQFDSQGFYKEADSFLQKNVKHGMVDYTNLKTEDLKSLIKQIEKFDLSSSSDLEKQAFYINAYNLHVINQVVGMYPIKSVMDKGGFFDKQKINVGGQKISLNDLERNYLLKPYRDARFHFVLVCGALGCPPITDFAYMPSKLDEQLEQQTRLALNDDSFIKVGSDKVELSEIFKWYADDFGVSNSNIRTFVNRYRKNKIADSAKLSFYKYDWSLNDASKSFGSIDAQEQATNESRYIVSSTIPKGSVELKIFNNLYSQKTGPEDNLSDRSSFFTTILSAMYGLSNRFNIGINTRFRKVRNNALPSSPFSIFGSGENGSSRSGLTAFGPQIRYAPVPNWTNFSIQSSFVFPIGVDLAGSETLPYIDWTGATWNTQFFNDFSIGTKFSLFTELAILLEDIGSAGNGHVNRLSTPITGIFSFTPSTKLTVYTLAGFSPYWQSDFDYFYQYGIGSKYQFTPNVEIELLYTDFTNEFLSNTGGQAETINIGFRFNL
jgi:hypothetical protein